jgi:hypothetical protein
MDDWLQLATAMANQWLRSWLQKLVAASKGEGAAFKKKEDTFTEWQKQTRLSLILSS